MFVVACVILIFSRRWFISQYVTNLNVALEKLDSAMSTGDVSGIIAIQGALKFNGGGHLNHTLFWENLSPTPTAPSGALDASIKSCFGDFEKMKAELSAKSVAVQGRYVGSEASFGCDERWLWMVLD